MVMTEQKSSLFQSYRAYRRLEELAKKPFDLTKPGNLSPARIEKYLVEGGGYKIFYATERIDDQVMDALQALSDESHAVEKMAAMQAGAITNCLEGVPSENRPVLHTAMRDFFDHPQTAEAAAQASRMEKREMEKLQKFLTKTEYFTDIVAIGIGGSNLGPESVYIALKAYQKPGRNAHFISNIDPDQIADTLKGLNLSKTLVVGVSKSGSTIETVTNEAFVRQKFVDAGLDPRKHFVSITGEKSPMDDPSRYMECFYSWDFVGGRFSTTAMYGAVTLSFTLGFDLFFEFLRGAHTMDRLALEKDLHQNIPLLLALLGIWNHNFLGYPILAVIPYAQALARFPAHVQQVDMESNGKHIDRRGQQVLFDTGPIIFGEPGTNAQHSFYQLIHQGTEIVPMELIGYRQCQSGVDLKIGETTNQQKLLSNLFAQAIALAEGQKSENPNKEFQGNRPSHIIFGDKLTPFTMGSLFAMVEHKVAFQGFIWDINSFDQEGVQLGKVLANRVLDRMAKKGQPYPVGDAYLSHLEF